MLSNVTINLIGGGTGRPQAGFDYYSGLILYGTAPNVANKWATYPGPPIIKAQQLLSPADGLAAGIIPFSDNVASQSKYAITTAGTSGNTLVHRVAVPKVNGTTEIVELVNYTVPPASNTIALQTADIVAAINAGTSVHGWTSTGTATEYTLIAPKNKGISLNSGTPYSVIVNGTFVGTITQNTVAGSASQYAIWDYHIREYFRINENGNLWVGIIAASSSFEEIVTLQSAASSKLRWGGIYDNSAARALAANITGTITQIDVAAKKVQKTAPIYMFYSPNINEIADLSTYPDQNINTANKVTTILSQDGDAEGAQLFVVSGQTIGNIGAKLGSYSKARVSASDAQAIPLFNMSDGVENNTPAFGNGLLSANVTANLQAQLDNFRYVFFRQFGDEVVGTYWSSNKSSITNSSDYANVNDNATADKISRILYSTYTPLLNSELIFNSDNTLKDYTIEYFKDQGTDAVTAGMITGYGNTPLISGIKLYIDPTQKVKVTENLVIVATVVQNGIARNITVNVGYGSI